MGRTHWKLPHLAGARSLSVTDSWRRYFGKEELCRYFAVNHSKEFVELHGYHTNHAERVYRNIKDWTEREHYNFGASAQDLKRNIALNVLKSEAYAVIQS